MKKIFKTISSLILIGACLLAGTACKINLDLNPHKTYVKISIDESRTINPDIPLSDLSDFNLYHNDEENCIGSWSTISEMTGKKIEIAEINPIDTFILTAKCGEAVYSDIQMVMLSEGDNNINFFLRPVVTESASTGNIELVLDIPEVLSINTNAETVYYIRSMGGSSASRIFGSNVLSNVEVKSETTELTYSIEELAAGIYEVAIQTKVDDSHYAVYLGYATVVEGLTSTEKVNALLLSSPVLVKVSFVTGDDSVTVAPCYVTKGARIYTSNRTEWENGDWVSVYTLEEFRYGTIANITPVSEDKVFGGWYWNEECTESADNNSSSRTVTEDITLYGKWNIPVTISFVTNADTAEIEPLNINSSQQVQFYSNWIWISSNGSVYLPYVEGKVITGIYYYNTETEEFGESIPLNGSSIYFNSDKTLYIKYGSYPTIYFEANVEGAEYEPIQITNMNWNSILFDNSEYYVDQLGWYNYESVEGYNFAGVYEDSEYTTKVSAGSIYYITEDTTFYVRYLDPSIKFNVSFVTNNSSATIDSLEVSAGSYINLNNYGFNYDGRPQCNYPTVENYIVYGVYSDESYTNRVYNYLVTEDSTLYVKYVDPTGTSLTVTISGDDAERFKFYTYEDGVKDFPATIEPKCVSVTCNAFIDVNENGHYDELTDIRVITFYSPEFGQSQTFNMNIVKTTATFTIEGNLENYDSDKLYVVNNWMQGGSSSKVKVPVTGNTGTITFYGNKGGNNGYDTSLALYYDADGDGNVDYYTDRISQDVHISATECETGSANVTIRLNRN